MPTHHLAQLNIARMSAPLESDEMSEFREMLGPINALADRSPGFVWRLKDEGGMGATGVDTPFDDDMVLVNLSVWTGVDELRAFVYGTVHSYFVRNRRRWFDRLGRPFLALWWVPIGEEPTLLGAKARLERIEREGPSPAAFTTARLYGPDGAALLTR